MERIIALIDLRNIVARIELSDSDTEILIRENTMETNQIENTYLE
jgi:hypothetical protein